MSSHRVTLQNMTTESYNGMQGTLVFTKTPQRVGVKLDDIGRLISVRLECVATEVKFPQCSICLEAMPPTTTQTLVCSHTFHRWCVNQWRNTGNADDVEASTKRCPVCRTYTGSSPKPILKKTAPEIVLTALGSIHQTVAKLKRLPEPSFEEELEAVITQITQCKLNNQAFQGYEMLQDAVDAFNKRNCEQNCRNLYDALLQCLIMHCFTDPSKHDDYTLRGIDMWMKSLFHN
jgi:hypothetical protein